MKVPTYSRGDVVFVEIVVSGSVGSKRKPVIVLSTDNFHRTGSKLIVAGVTSNIASPSRAGDVFLADWQLAGLIKPSAVRGLVTTIDRIEIIRKLGALSDSDFANVERGIADVLGLVAS